MEGKKVLFILLLFSLDVGDEDVTTEDDGVMRSRLKMRRSKKNG